MKIIMPTFVTWNLTQQCNLSCSYCCGTLPGRELSYNEKLKVIHTLSDYNLTDIGISGGEPFILKNIINILKILDDHNMSIGINTNGIYLTEEIQKKLAKLDNIDHIYITLDGWEKDIHEKYRGKNTFKTIISNARKLSEYNIPFSIIHTVTPDTKDRLSNMARLCYEIGARTLIFNGVLPIGKGKEVKGQILNPSETFEVLKTAFSLYKEYYPELRITSSYPFSFLASPKKLVPLVRKIRKHQEMTRYCGIGFTRLFISPSGVITPCTFIHKKIGHILKDNLEDLWNSEKMEKYRNYVLNPKGKCSKCVYKDICGGCRAAALHIGGKIDGEDPRCPLEEVEHNV